MKAKIDLEKFICSYVKWNNIQDALKDQGLICWNGEIVEIEQESEDERIRKELIDYINRLTVTPNNIDRYNSWVTWLEKQGEQKSIFDFNANNWYVSKGDGKIHNIYNSGVEPKFHKDEWVVNNATLNLCHILRVEHGQYICDDCSFPITKENEYHLWTIQDAKGGDVVVDKSDGTIGIFESIGHHPDGGSYNDPSYCFLHCHYDDGFFYADFEDGNTMDSDDVIPATKEQCDTLFAKMKEAGYEFDFEKKELKKIEDEEYNSEDYGIDGLFHAQRILEKTLGKVKGYQTDDGILSHKCAITAVKKLYEQKPTEWSEQDERMCQETIDWFERKCFPYALEEENPARESIKWLRSLKQRMGGEE